VAAANLLARAAAGEARDADRARILYDLGDALLWVGELQPSFDAFDEAARLASEAGDPLLELMAGLRRSETLTLTDPHAKPTDEFRSELEDAVHVFEEVGDDAALATVWTQLAEIEWMPCRYDRAQIAAGRAIDHARRSGDERLLTNPLLTSIKARMSGSTTPEEGIRGLDDLRDDLSRSRQMEALAFVARAFHLSMGGRFGEARRLIGLADAAVQALGLQLWRAFLREVLGYIELYAGDVAAAERAFREDYEILDELGDEGHKSTAAANLALALCAIGRFDEAEPLAEIAVRVAAEDDLASQTSGRSARALVLAARGELVEAERLAREAVDLLAGAETPNSEADAWLDLAKVQRMAGNTEDAARSAREALARYERKGNQPAAASTRAFIDELGQQRSDNSSTS
jgi:tetratricopeptide (TPR) repeat protein